MVDPVPPLSYKAIVKLGYLVTDKDGHMAFSYQKKFDAVINATNEAAKFDDILSFQLKTLQEKYRINSGKASPIRSMLPVTG